MREKLKPVIDILKQKTENELWKVILGFAVSSLAFFLIGWMVFGWYIVPVEWIPPEPPTGMSALEYQSKATYTLLLSEWYAYSGNDEKLYYFSRQLDDIDVIACSIGAEKAERARLVTIAYMRNGVGCNEPIDSGE